MALKNYSGRYWNIYIPDSFKNHKLRFFLNTQRDHTHDDKKLLNSENKEALILRELVIKYNELMDKKYGKLVMPEEQTSPEESQENAMEVANDAQTNTANNS